MRRHSLRERESMTAVLVFIKICLWTRYRKWSRPHRKKHSRALVQVYLENTKTPPPASTKLRP